MSVLSTLALLVTTAAVKSKPKKADRVAELEAEIVGLKIDLAEARRDLELERNCTVGLQRELARAQARHGVGPDFRPHGLQQAQALLNQMAQAQCQNAQQAQYAAMQNIAMQNLVYGQALAQQQGLLGAQGLAQSLNPEMWCNCVPSRAQVWAANGG